MGETSKHHEPLKLTLFFKNPATCVTLSQSVLYLQSTTFDEVIKDAYKFFEIEKIAPIEDCYLVEYDSSNGEVGGTKFKTEFATRYEDDFAENHSIGIKWRSRKCLFNKTSELLLFVGDFSLDLNRKSCLLYVSEKFNPYKPRLQSIEITAQGRTTLSEIEAAISEQADVDYYSKIVIAVRESQEDKAEILQSDGDFDTVDLFSKYRFFATTKLGEKEFLDLVELIDCEPWFLTVHLPYELLTSLKNFENISRVVYNFHDESQKMIYQSTCFTEVINCGGEKIFFFETRLVQMIQGQENSKSYGETCRIFLTIEVDDRMSVNEFLTRLEGFIEIPDRSLFGCLDQSLSLKEGLRQSYLSGELANAIERVAMFKNTQARKDGDILSDIYYLNMGNGRYYLDELPMICHYLIRNSAEVGQSKREIIEILRRLDKHSNISFDLSRLRLYSMIVPSEILLDEQHFGDGNLETTKTYFGRFQIVIQELESEDLLKFDSEGNEINGSSIALFIQRFYPAELEVSRWYEIVVGKDITVDRIKTVITEQTEINLEDIQYTIVSLACTENMQMSYIDELIELDSLKSEEEASDRIKWLCSGNGIVFKDKTEKLQEAKSLKALRREFAAGR